MKTKNKNIIKDIDEYTCPLTEALDKYLIGYSELYKTYLLDIRDEDSPRLLAIRVPGCTIGDLELNDGMTIRSAAIGSDCLDMFTTNPNEILRQFIGEELEMTEGGGQEDVK